MGKITPPRRCICEFIADHSTKWTRHIQQNPQHKEIRQHDAQSLKSGPVPRIGADLPSEQVGSRLVIERSVRSAFKPVILQQQQHHVMFANQVKENKNLNKKSAMQLKKELDEQIAHTMGNMDFSQVSIAYNAGAMCHLCWQSSKIGLGTLSCCKRSLVHDKCVKLEYEKQQPERKKRKKEILALGVQQDQSIVSPCCRGVSATFIPKQDLCKYCHQLLGDMICTCKGQKRSTRSQAATAAEGGFQLPQQLRPVEEIIQQNAAYRREDLSLPKSVHQPSLERPPTLITNEPIVVVVQENSELKALKEELQKLSGLVQAFAQPHPQRGHSTSQWNGGQLENATQQAQEMNLEQLKKDETWKCRRCGQRFAEIGWNSHAIDFPQHKTCDIYQLSTGKLLRTVGEANDGTVPPAELTPDASDSDGEVDVVVADAEEETKRSYSHLSQERRPRRNQPGAVSAQEDLSEEKLHTHFLGELQGTHNLQLAAIDWSFIAGFPAMRTGNAICPMFIDGLLYPEDASHEKTFRQWDNLLKQKFGSCGLNPKKVIQKKRQEYHKATRGQHRPYFIKLDDYNYDFTEERIGCLQRATQQLQTELLKLDVTLDYEGCLFVPNVKKLEESPLAKLLGPLGFKVRCKKNKYKQLPTCVCFEREDCMVTFYNKPVQRFETDIVTSKIGNGLQTIFGSSKIAEKFQATQQQSFFRIEVRWRWDDEKQLQFVEQEPKKFYKRNAELLESLRKLAYQSGCIHKVPISVLWDQLWKQVKSYHVVISKGLVTIVFGYNPYSSKYFGARYKMGKNKYDNKFIEKFLKVYGLTGRDAHVFKFQDKKRYSVQAWKKTAGRTALTLETLFKETEFNRVHMEEKTIQDFGLQQGGGIQFQLTKQNLLSTAKLEEGKIIHTSLCRQVEAKDKEEHATTVEKRYKKTKAAQELKGSHEFIYFSFNTNHKTIYLYDTTDTQTKYYYWFRTIQLFDKFNVTMEKFLEKYPDSFTKLNSGGILFQDFKVKVTASFGELKLTKGSTEESSDEEEQPQKQDKMQQGQDQEPTDVRVDNQSQEEQPMQIDSSSRASQLQREQQDEEEELQANLAYSKTLPRGNKEVRFAPYEERPSVELEKKKLQQRKAAITLGKRSNQQPTLENIPGPIQEAFNLISQTLQRTTAQQEHLAKPAKKVKKRDEKQQDKEHRQRKGSTSNHVSQLSQPTDRSKNRNKINVCDLCRKEMRADNISTHRGGKMCRKWQNENENK